MGKIAVVVVSNSTRKFDKEYYYLIPDAYQLSIEIGMRVLIPFGRMNKKIEGLVINIINKEVPRLKSIYSLIDKSPIINNKMIELIYWMKEKYVCTYYEALNCIVPSFEKKAKEKKVKVVFLIKDKKEILEKIEGNFMRNIWQIKILKILLENEYMSVSDIIKYIGGGRSSINTLVKNGFIACKDIAVERDPYNLKKMEKDFAKTPTQEQKNILDNIKEIMNFGLYREVLIHGVTGSGKTEVYLQLIEYCIKSNKNAIVLVPEISLTPQMMDRFKARFGEKVAVIHSRLSIGERYDQWNLIKSGKIQVVVGVRSAVFVPLDNIGIIIIDEEHENSYKSETVPKYNAKDIAKFRCAKENAILLYGSATPSVETYYKAVNNEIILFNMKNRTNKCGLPEVKLVDMRQELENGNRTIFSNSLKNQITKNIENKEQTILFLNRRGHSSFVLCRSCGFAVKCVRCNVTLTYHKSDDRLICHYCGYTIKNLNICPKCKSNYIRSFGLGTQRVEEEVKKIFPDASVIRMDLDTTSYKNAHDEILSKFRDENINILIGTQMIAKGHDFPNVTLVGVLAADSMLNVGDFRSSEKTFQLLTQVAGRAGRGQKSGRVIIQTYNMDDYSIKAAIKQDYNEFYTKEIKLRNLMQYPPFSDIGVLVFSGENDKFTYDNAMKIKEFVENIRNERDMKFDILGASRAPISKIKNKNRWKLIIKSKNVNELLYLMTIASDEFHKKKVQSVQLSIDINPTSML